MSDYLLDCESREPREMTKMKEKLQVTGTESSDMGTNDTNVYEECGYEMIGCHIADGGESPEKHHSRQWLFHVSAVGLVAEFTANTNIILQAMSTRISSDGSPPYDRLMSSLNSCHNISGIVTTMKDFVKDFWTDTKIRTVKLYRIMSRINAIIKELENCKVISNSPSEEVLVDDILGAIELNRSHHASGDYPYPMNSSGFSAAWLRRYNEDDMRRDESIAELVKAEEALSTISYQGTTIIRVGSFDQEYREAITQKQPVIQGATFCTSRYGYALSPKVMLYGDSGVPSAYGNFMSVDVEFIKSNFDDLLDYPVVGCLTICLRNLYGGEDYTKEVPFEIQRPPNVTAVSASYYVVHLSKFIRHSLLHSGSYVKNDTIFVCFTAKVND